jgi:hypothetical protein
MADGGAPVRITTDGVGGGSVVVDGQDISKHVVGLSLRVQPGRADDLQLEIMRSVDATTYGEPTFVADAFGGHGQGPTPVAAIASLLADLERRGEPARRRDPDDVGEDEPEVHL